jgi:hypothetical protein
MDTAIVIISSPFHQLCNFPMVVKKTYTRGDSIDREACYWKIRNNTTMMMMMMMMMMKMMDDARVYGQNMRTFAGNKNVDDISHGIMFNQNVPITLIMSNK